MEVLSRLYTDPASPAAFAGVDKLYHEARKVDNKITKKQVLNYLEGNDGYTLHKPRRTRYKRLKTVPTGLFTDMQADLADVRSIASHNDGHYYILVCVDVLSRRVFAWPVKRKTAEYMKKAFDQVFSRMPALPHNIYTDKG